MQEHARGYGKGRGLLESRVEQTASAVDDFAQGLGFAPHLRDQGEALAWLHAHGEVLAQTSTDHETAVTVRLAQPDMARFKRRFESTTD